MKDAAVPFFRPDLSGGEIEEVVATLKSGWLTAGPRVKMFEETFCGGFSVPVGLGERAEGDP
jgi:dTDP-4-amino-4,6-dideoxygalactose transaminase